MSNATQESAYVKRIQESSYQFLQMVQISYVISNLHHLIVPSQKYL